MKLNEALKLENGQKVMHKRYGECIAKEVIMAQGEFFGVVITPITEAGRFLLGVDSETDIPDYLEDSVRSLSVENIPGTKPIDQKTAWGKSEKDLPESEPKDYFAPKDEEVPR